MTDVTRRSALIIGTGLALVPLVPVTRALAQTPTDVQFGHDGYVMSTLQGGAVSMAMSEMALERAGNREVREFAELEIAEQRTIAGVLAATGVPGLGSESNTAREMTPGQRAIVDRITAAEAGDAFDLAYIEGQIALHNDLLQVQQMMTGEQDPSVEAITARLTAQAIHSHIAMLNFIQQLMGAEHIEAIESPDGEQRRDSDEIAN